MEKRHIFLTGFMGAGKSKVGRLLAQQLGFLFMDTDQEIERRAGLTVREIFEQKGETFFRQLERQVVQQVCENPACTVVALGGGALNDPQTFEQVKKSGVVVYLKSSPAAIFNRVKHSDKRPLLDVQAKSPEERERILLQRIEQLLKKREDIYNRADIVFNRDGMEAEQVAGRLITLLKTLEE